MGEEIRQAMAEEFQEVPPTEYSVFGLAKACSISDWCTHISCHVFGSFLKRKIEEPATHIPHAADNII